MIQVATRLIDNVAAVIRGKRGGNRARSVIALLARGHLLLDDVPGRGQDHPRARPRRLGRPQVPPRAVHAGPDARRTSPAHAIYDHEPAAVRLRRRPGVHQHPAGRRDQPRDAARRSPRCSSAWQERQVTVDGTTYPLAEPFFVIATQNPVEQRGHLPAARGAARPLPDPRRHRLPGRGGRGRDPEEPGARRGRIRWPRSSRRSARPSWSAMAEGHRGHPHQRRGAHDYIARIAADLAQGLAPAPGDQPARRPRADARLQARALLDGKAFVEPATVKAMALPVLARTA
mgnify:CR=1 FL=1